MAFLNRWDPFTEIARLQDEMTRHLYPNERRYSGFVPPVDILEEKDAIYMKAELPGVKPDEVQLHVENNILTISGERKFDKEEKKEGYHRIERSYGTFTRSFALPKGVDADKVEADIDAGVLTVRIPKRAAPEPRRITVRAGSEAAKPS